MAERTEAVIVDSIQYRTIDPLHGLLCFGTRTYPDPEIIQPIPPSGLSALLDNRIARSLAIVPFIMGPAASELHALLDGGSSVIHDGGLTGSQDVGISHNHGLSLDNFTLPSLVQVEAGITAWAVQGEKTAAMAMRTAGDVALGVLKAPLYILSGEFSCFPSPEAQAKAAGPTVKRNENSHANTVGLTDTFRSDLSPAAARMQSIVNEASTVWTGHMDTPVNTVTMDIIVPDRSLLVPNGPTPQYVMKDKDGRLWAPFYGLDGHLIRYIPVPSADSNPASIEWIRGDNPRLEIAMAAGARGVYDQTIGSFVVIPKDGDRQRILDAVNADRENLALYAKERFAALDQKNPDNKSIVRLEPYTSNGKILFIGTVRTTKGTDSTWGEDTLGNMVPLSFDPNILWIPDKRGMLVAHKTAENGKLTPTGEVFDPNGEPGSQVTDLTKITPTPSPTAPPPPTATREPTPTTAPTLAPTVTREPTKIPLPEPVVVARYGDENDKIDFRTLPMTSNVFFNESTWGTLKNPTLGVRTFAYLTFPSGKPGYDLWREGKSGGGKIYFVSAYFLPVQESRWVDQAKGIFVIKSQIVNTKGVTVFIETTLNKDNPVYSHIPPTDIRWGAYFAQMIGSGGSVQSSPGLMRNRKSETEFDVIGLGGPDNTNAEAIRNAIDGYTSSNEDKPFKINGVANNQSNNWLILLAH